MGETIEAKLEKLGVFLDSVVQNAEIFRAAKTMDELGEQIRGKDTRLNSEQFLFTYFPKLVKQHPEILDMAETQLANTGVPGYIIREYLVQVQHPGMIIGTNYGKQYDHEVLEGFCDAANQFALDEMRRYLETESNDN